MALAEAYFMTQNNSFHLLCTTRHCGTCFFSAEFWHNAIDNVDPVEKVYNYTHAHTLSVSMNVHPLHWGHLPLPIIWK